MTEGRVIIEAREVTKRFPGVLALDRVNFRVVEGQVNALVGENGAGKSTLMNILSGVYTDYDGQLLADGEVRRFSGVADARQCGIAIIHQELCNVPYMNIAENMFLGREPLTPSGLIDRKRMHRDAREWLDRLHYNVDTHVLTGNLRVGQQQLVEIAKALSMGARVLIMDEPTSSLSDKEAGTLFQLIGELKQKGVGIVYISHKMDEVWRLADYVTVLCDGRVIAERRMSETSPDEVIRLMVGREGKAAFERGKHEIGAYVLQLEGLSMRDVAYHDRLILNDVSLGVRKGEVLGLYGLMGAGRTELLEAVFGLHSKNVAGIVRIDGREVNIRHPREAVEQGLAFCPEDRKRDGLALSMSIVQNTTMAALKKCLTRGLIVKSKELRFAEYYQRLLDIVSTSTSQLAGSLSGGNQQKVVLGKWLMTMPKVLFLDEPTRGIDIHAKNEIYRLIDQLSQKGMAIVVVSSELPEIMAVSDRIVTIRQGRVGQIFNREDFSEELILKASLPE